MNDKNNYIKKNYKYNPETGEVSSKRKNNLGRIEKNGYKISFRMV